MTAVWGPGSRFDTIAGFPNPRKPVGHYLHDLSGSFYLHAPMNDGVPTATSVGKIGTLGVLGDGSGFLGELKRALSVKGGNQGKWEQSIYQLHETGEKLAARHGVRFTSYETGIEIFKPGQVGAAWSDPEMRVIYYNLLAHMRTMPHADVAVQSATVRGVRTTNELSRSYSAADGFPWPLTGTPSPTPMWQAVMDFAAGR